MTSRFLLESIIVTSFITTDQPQSPAASYNYVSLAMEFGTCERTIRRMVLRGELPAPIRIGRSVRWPASVIRAWVQDRAAAGIPATGDYSGS